MGLPVYDHAQARLIVDAALNALQIRRPDGGEVEIAFRTMACAGWYLPRDERIEINEALFPLYRAHRGDGFGCWRLIAVALHEVAHLLVSQSPELQLADAASRSGGLYSHGAAFFLADAALLMRAARKSYEIADRARAALGSPDEFCALEAYLSRAWTDLQIYDICGPALYQDSAAAGYTGWSPSTVDLAALTHPLSWALSRAKRLADSPTPAQDLGTVALQEWQAEQCRLAARREAKERRARALEREAAGRAAEAAAIEEQAATRRRIVTRGAAVLALFTIIITTMKLHIL